MLDDVFNAIKNLVLSPDKVLVNRYKKGVENGDANAQYNLARLHESGNKGVEKNLKKAARLYKKAAEQGLAKAQVKLGILYYQGEGIKKDLDKAIKCFKNASPKGVADFDSADAQLWLSIIYAEENSIKNTTRALKYFKPAKKWLKKAAQSGDINAQYRLARLYHKGILGSYKVNLELAIKWYERAAEQGHMEAQFCLGRMFETGEGVTINLTKAIGWYEKAVKQGHANAQYNLADVYGEEIEDAKKEECLKRLVARGVNDIHNARANLGLCEIYAMKAVLSAREEISEDHRARALTHFSIAEKWLEKAAEKGDAEAQFELGYMNEQEVPGCHHKNLTQAERWYKKAAKQGYADAQNNLAYLLHNGEGIEKNLTKAAEWYMKAAERGHSVAQYNLAAMLEKGEGVKKNLTEAAKWYIKAAERGHLSARASLAMMFYKGKGVKKNLTKAREWCEKAAKQGHSVAQCNLGYMLEKDEKNLKEALKWYEEAAIQDDAAAKYRAAIILINGLGGVERNPRKAEKYLRQAAKQGYAGSRSALASLLFGSGRGDTAFLEAARLFRDAANQGDDFAYQALHTIRLIDVIHTVPSSEIPVSEDESSYSEVSDLDTSEKELNTPKSEADELDLSEIKGGITDSEDSDSEPSSKTKKGKENHSHKPHESTGSRTMLHAFPNHKETPKRKREEPKVEVASVSVRVEDNIEAKKEVNKKRKR